MLQQLQRMRRRQWQLLFDRRRVELGALGFRTLVALSRSFSETRLELAYRRNSRWKMQQRVVADWNGGGSTLI
jgi:hypothetical protein